MKLGRLGVWYGADKLDGPQLRDFVRTVENNGYSTLWYPESRGYESMSLAAWLLSSSQKLVIGSSIANIYARDSFTAQRAVVSLNALYGGRFVLGLGVSHIPMVEGLRGIATTNRWRRWAPISTASTSSRPLANCRRSWSQHSDRRCWR